MNSFLLNSLNKNISIPIITFRYYQWRITNVLSPGNYVQSAQFVFQINGID